MSFPVIFRRVFRLACLVIVTKGAWGAAAGRAAEHMVHISIDGLHARFMQEMIDAGDAPHLKRLQEEGAWTLNARTDYAYTNTLPNHASMFTGRPALPPEEMPELPHHGWTTNRTPARGEAIHDFDNPHIGYVASVFDVVHDAGRSTALYATKDKFVLFAQSYDEHYGAAHEHGRNKIDIYFFANDGPPRFSATMHERFLADMAERRFNYVFLHYCDPDSVGHQLGWGSSGWRYAVQTIDGYLGQILRLIDTDEQLAGRTALIVTTDHGGTGYTHDNARLPENYTVPILVWGAGVGRGELYAINAESRADPGDARPGYTEPIQPIRNGDTGNLALSLLRLPAIPGSVINAEQDLRVALLGDFNLDGVVDQADYILWSRTKGSTTELWADGNNDGVVDEADYEIWRANFGRSAMPESTQRSGDGEED